MKHKLIKLSAAIGLVGVSAAAWAVEPCCIDLQCCIEMLACCFS